MVLDRPKTFSKKVFITISYLSIFSFVKTEASLAMKITSSEFEHQSSIPQKFTCQGKGVNPGLIIEEIPQNTKSLALIMDDPDAPGGTFVHWVVYDIPVANHIAEDSVPGEQGSNDGGGVRYVGPCPPSGSHRYFFKIYALDKIFNFQKRVNKASLENAMSGHILGQAELVGLYKKK